LTSLSTEQIFNDPSAAWQISHERQPPRPVESPWSTLAQGQEGFSMRTPHFVCNSDVGIASSQYQSYQL